MATATKPIDAKAGPSDSPPAPSGPAAGGARLALRGVSFATYRALRSELDQAGDRARLTFDRGTLEIMVLSYEHEQGGYLLGRLIEAVAAGLRIPIAGAKSTTFSREDIDRGIEADESYYVINEPRIRFHKAIDLSVDPPPDLAIEIDVSRSSVNKTEVYASLGVAEFWRFDDGHLHILRLDDDGRYQPTESSVNFPVLTRADVEDWVRRRESMDQTTWFLALLDWSRDELAARRDAQPGR